MSTSIPAARRGVVQPAEVGITPDLKIDAMQRKLPMHLRCGAHCRTTHWTAVRQRRDAEWAVPDARRSFAGRSEGGKQALKQGRYSAEAITSRREVAALIRAMRALACTTEEAAERSRVVNS